jgi:TRAP-type transport system small permease protein
MVSVSEKRMSLSSRIGYKFETGFRYLENLLANAGSIFALAIMLLGAGDVIGRYVFNHPLTGAMEIESLLMGLIVFAGWAYITSNKGHVSVDILSRHYPARVKAIVNCVSLILTLLLFGLIAWKNIFIASDDFQKGITVDVIGISPAPFKIIIAIGAIFLCIECLIQLVHTATKIIGKKEK